MKTSFPTISGEAVREMLRAGREVALIDVREEEAFAQSHPLFAAQMPVSRLEADAAWRLPRRDVALVVYDDGEGLAEPAAARLAALGYSAVHRLEGDLGGWRSGGGELFRDVNVPSKAFGELVEHDRATPSLPAAEVRALIDSGADLVVLDARRFDEYQVMSIPGAVSVPGAELALRARELAPDPATRIVVNCAGRTRSIIGTQSLVNAGIPNPVHALRNGTIGWLLAGLELDHGANRRAGTLTPTHHAVAANRAAELAGRAGAARIDGAALAGLEADLTRTLYRLDVRSPEEYAAGHRPDFDSAPGGQLVQETDHWCAVRGARIVLDDGGEGVRAAMTAHWLAQLGWEVAWIADGAAVAAATETGAWRPRRFDPPAIEAVEPRRLAEIQAAGGICVIDLGPAVAWRRSHVPGSWWALRSQFASAWSHIVDQGGDGGRIVLSCPEGLLSPWAAQEVAAISGRPVTVLAGGVAAWKAAGLPCGSGDARRASPQLDRYRRPYEGTDAPRAAMQAYLDWEFGLVEQLARDRTHGFKVLAAD